MMKLQTPLTEPHAILDIFVSGMARADRLAGDLYRLTFYADSICAFDGRAERIIVSRFVMAASTINDVSSFVAKAMEKSTIVAANN